jgi:hypothetical protein
VRRELLVLGLVVIVIGSIIYAQYDIIVDVDVFINKNTTQNTYTEGEILKFNVTAFYNAGERLFFNFTMGKYWSGTDEQRSGGLEPSITEENFAIPPFKIITFLLYTPSGDICEIAVWVVYGEDPYVIIYNESQSKDLTPLPYGNLTFYNVGFTGIVNTSGNYTIEAYAAVPPIHKTDTETVDIKDDPPRIMSLWIIDTIKTKPYQLLLPLGIIISVSGLILCIWAIKPKRKSKGPLKTPKLRLKKSKTFKK